MHTERWCYRKQKAVIIIYDLFEVKCFVLRVAKKSAHVPEIDVLPVRQIVSLRLHPYCALILC